MKRIIYVFFIAFFAISSCKNNENQPTTVKETPTTQAEPNLKPISNLNDSGTNQLATIVSDYLSLKNSLVAAIKNHADTSANQLCKSAVKLQSYLLVKNATPGPLKPFLDTIIMQCRAIMALTDKSCEKQRIEFATLSSALFGLIKETELKNMKIYRDYCPMALNEKGAFWLSRELDIRNPYFGSKMLECGEVTDTIK